MNVEFAFSDDFKDSVGDDSKAFVDELSPQLADGLKVDEKRLNNLTVSPGTRSFLRLRF